jgi:hypothetical protein
MGFRIMTWEVLSSIQVRDWLLTLEEDSFARVLRALGELAVAGPQLGRPLVGKIVGSKIGNLKELRPSSGSSGHIRILFAFDPKRRAILLVAGDKKGEWQKWYKTNIPLAETMLLEHLGNL